MNKKTITILLGVTVLIAAGTYAYLTRNDENLNRDIRSGFREYVSAYTFGKISKKSNLIIEFVDEVADRNTIGKTLDNNLISLSPEVAGKIKWINSRTLEFIPDQLFESNRQYTLELDIAAVIPTIPDSLSDFSYQFSTIKQMINMQFEPLQNVNNKSLEYQKLNGKLLTTDFESSENVEEFVYAELDDDALDIHWLHSADGKTHEFLVDSIQRKDFQQSLEVGWDATDIDANSGKRSFEIWAIGDFRFLSASVVNGADQFVSFTFSDPVDPKQDLNGLIRIGDYDVTYAIAGNIVRAYPTVRLIGNIAVKVERGVKNIVGHSIQKSASSSVNFIEIKPQVKLRGKGVIIPATADVPFLFEAVNLSAVDVRVIRIFEKSVPQFLQVNELNGSRELRRVGHVVANKKVDLAGNPNLDLKSWNIHSLELSEIVQAEPGAIYEIAIGFRRSYSLYTCSDTSAIGDSDDMLALGSGWAIPEEETEDSYWDYYEPDYQENYWEDRDNPCKNTFYSSDKLVKRNILASSLGLTAKMGESRDLFVAVTDLNTTIPLADVTIEIYNYQQHLIKRIRTASDGTANVKLNETPYLLIAKKAGQRGYLRLDDGQSLSVSRFDIGGAVHREGLKGFIYGERGVWRPGDSLYLNFILNDIEKPIPVDHPLVFELSNPSGQIVKRIIKKENVNGFYTFHTATKIDDPTGNYLARVRVGGVSFTKSLKIETVVPNRLRLKLDFDVPYLSPKNNDYETELAVNWLHGAVGKNLKTTVEANLNQSVTRFKGYQDYVFDDPSRSFYSENKILFEGELDGDGKAMISASNLIANEESPGMLKANFTGKAFEPGGNFSVDRFSVPYSPYDSYIGLKTPKGDKARGIILTDTNHTVKLVAVDPDGKAIEKTRLDVSLYKLEWKWWWDKTAYTINYNGRYFNQPLKQDSVTIENGKGNWTLRLNYPQWGRYLVRACDDGGHCTGKIIYMDWPGWAGRGSKEKNAGSSMLSFTADKKSYEVGDEVVINIPTGAEGRALLTLENENKVVQSYWVNAQKGTTRYTFKATADMVPNVFAHISLVQPHAQTKNDLPIRMYGVIPLMVKNPRTILEPQIRMPDVLKPESTVSISVSEKNNQPMTYTLALVDEGLLDLTRFKTPKPWNYFFQRQALRVKTWDLFDHVLGAEADKVNSLLSIGGDEGLNAGQGGSKQNRFKPVVKFLGPFSMEAGATQTHRIKIPNYIGSVKTMVVAGNEEAYGHASKATPVKKPLMVLGSLPRKLSPTESIQLPVTVFAMEEKVKEVSVRLVLNDLLELEGEANQKLSFSQPGEEILNFKLKAKEAVGNGTVKIIATSGNERAVYHVDVAVTSPNPVITETYTQTIKAGEEWNQELTPFGIKGTNNTLIEVSSIPPLNLGNRLEYLIRYPHGCIEQTTSGAFPQLYLKELLSLSQKRKAEIDKNVKGGLSRLLSFQTSDGGMAYWPNMSHSNEWGTNYAGHFMIEAQNAGYTVSPSVMDRWTDYQNKKARSWNGGDDNSQLTQAYRLYLLALSNNPELSSMNRMRLNRNLNNLAKLYLAAAYMLASRNEAADGLLKGVDLSSAPAGNYRRSYGSLMRNEAIMLQTLLVAKKWDAADKIAIKLSEKLNSKNWYSTQSTAFTLVSLAKYSSRSGKPVQFSYQEAGGEWANVSSDKSVWQSDFDGKSLKSVKIKGGEHTVYAKVMQRGAPLVGDESSSSNGLEIEVNYFDINNNSIDYSDLKQGEDFKAQLKVTNTGDKSISDLAFTYAVPSGWEIHNDRLDGAQSQTHFNKPTYLDQRDDRIHYYFDLQPKQKVEYEVRLNATYLGKYYLPTAYVEAMYDNSVNGRNGGEWIDVIK